MFEELIEAIKASNIKEVNIIMNQISNEELKKTDKQGFTVLHWASLHSSVDIIESILKKAPLLINASTEVTNSIVMIGKLKWTILHSGIQNSDKRVIQLLIEKNP